MRKTFLSASLMFLLISTCALGIGGDMGLGTEPLTDGSETYPYLIEDLADFDVFADDPNYWAASVYTKLMTDIDLSGRTYTTAVIAPDTDPNYSEYIGTPFNAIFDGNEFAIVNLTIDIGEENIFYLGLFGKIMGTFAEIKNLTMETVSIPAGSHYVGGLVSELREGAITNCHIKGDIINGIDHTGGLVGYQWEGSISNCSVTDTDITGFQFVGGLVGNCHGGVSNCIVQNCAIDAPRQTGGLVGLFNLALVEKCQAINNIVIGTKGTGGLVGSGGGSIENCWSSGLVSGIQWVGGLRGANQGSISDCYSISTVSGDERVGGLVGWNGTAVSTGSIARCYSTGYISGNSYVGGLLGDNYSGSVGASFWDTETSGQTISDGGTGKTTAEMMMQSTFTDWDFTTPVWMMLREGEDTPRLAWQEVFAGDIAGLYGADMVDFAEIARNWQNTGCPANCEDADIDLSGDVGLGDLAAVASDWLK